MENDKRLEPNKDLSIENRDGEIWKDVFGYDGLYQVSNFGRVKSLLRYSSSGLRIREKILKQNYSCSVTLFNEGFKTSYQVKYLVGVAFVGEKKEQECYYHKNKIKTDNRALNIGIGTISFSRELDYKLGIRDRYIIGGVASKDKKEYDLLVNNEDYRTCVCCKSERPLSDYYINSSYVRRECKTCTQIRLGNQNLNSRNNSIELAKQGLRICSKCQIIKKLDFDFHKNKAQYMGRTYTCKVCTKNTPNHD